MAHDSYKPFDAWDEWQLESSEESLGEKGYCRGCFMFLASARHANETMFEGTDLPRDLYGRPVLVLRLNPEGKADIAIVSWLYPCEPRTKLMSEDHSTTYKKFRFQHWEILLAALANSVHGAYKAECFDVAPLRGEGITQWQLPCAPQVLHHQICTITGIQQR